MKSNQILIRNIRPEDNFAMGSIVKEVLKEFALNIPGTAYFDESTDHLYDFFQRQGSTYLVAVDGDTIVGGVGIFPTDGLPADTVELVKMYLLPAYRGQGLGKQLINSCLVLAKEFGYGSIYLESMPQLSQAVLAYEKLGFKHLTEPMGNTGHYSCTLWMLYQL